MTDAVCLIAPDLSTASIGGAVFRADDPDAAPTLAAIRKRAAAAAEWIASEAPGKRLGALVLDLDQSLCLWTRTPSLRQPILEAAVRRAAEQLSAVLPAGAAELASIHGPIGAPTVAVTAIWHADGPARILLDQLDRRSIRPASVMSLWHAIGGARSDEDRGPAATILLEEERLAWTWSGGSELRAAGQIARASDHDIDRLASRLSMDWLAWSAHLGGSPTRVRVITAPSLAGDARAIADRLGAQWETTTDVDERDDPLEWLARSASRPGVASFAGLGNRPTRRNRRRLHLSALAIALLAAAAVGLSLSLTSHAVALQRVAAQIERDAVEQIIKPTEPEIAAQRRPSSALRSRIQELREVARTPPPLPPEPRPFTDVASRILETLAEAEPAPVLRDMQMQAQEGVTLRVTVEDLEAAIRLVESLRQLDLPLTWQQPQTQPSRDEQIATIQGRWT